LLFRHTLAQGRVAGTDGDDLRAGQPEVYRLRPRREIHDLAHSRKEFFPYRAALHKLVALLHTALYPFGVAL
jgi:hypothetical protein